MGDSLASPPSTERLAAYDSSPSARAIRNRVSLKRCYLVALPSDEDEAKASPRKKPKSLLTSVGVWLCQIDVLTMTIMQASVKRNSELEDLHAMRLLELVRASRATFTAHAKYQRLRLKELDIVRSMAIDECEEAESLLKEVEWQAGEVKNAVDQDGPGLLNRASGLFLREDDGNLDSESEDNLSDCKGSGPSNHNLASPTPSVDSSSDVS